MRAEVEWHHHEDYGPSSWTAHCPVYTVSKERDRKKEGVYMFVVVCGCMWKNYSTKLNYLTVVPPVSSGKNNFHCIRHDVDRSLVLLPIFGVGFLSEKYNCLFDILDVNVGKWIFFPLLSRKYLIHNVVVGSGQSQIHGVHFFSEPEFTRMLTVIGLTEDFAG